MSNTLFHNKFHLTNHHTVSSVGYPDSGIDPIAGINDPFLGPFYNVIESQLPFLSSNSIEWYSSYTVICGNSANYFLYNTTLNTVTALSSNWQGGSAFYNSYSLLSAGLNFGYTFTNENSAHFPFLSTTIRGNIPQENIGAKTFTGVTLTPFTVSANMYGDFISNSFVTLTGNYSSFVRNSSASYTDEKGFIRFADIDEGRRDFTYSESTSTWEPEGLLLERTKTNLILYSDELDNSVWVTYGALTVTPNNILSPANTLSAELIFAPASNNGLYQTVSVLPQTVYTMSMYARLGTMAAEDYEFAIFDLSNGAYIARNVTPTILPNKKTWTRISYTFTTPAGCNTIRLFPYANQFPAGGTAYIWGVQLEQGDFASSYIQTRNTSYTRSTEYAFLSGDYFNNLEGTFLFETKLLGTTANTGFTLTRFFGRDSFGRDTDILLRYLDDWTPNARGLINNSFILTFNINSNLINTSFPRALALSYSRNNVVLADYGEVVGIDSTSLIPNSLSSIYIGLSAPNALGDVYNGYIRRFAYYPRQLSNNSLRYLTLPSYEYSTTDEAQIAFWDLSASQVAFLNLSATMFLHNPMQAANKRKGGDFTLVIRQNQAGNNQLIFDRDYVTISGLSSTDIISLSSFSVTVIKFTTDGNKLYGKPTRYYYGLPDEFTYYSGPGIILNPNPSGLNAGEPFRAGAGGLNIGVSAPYSSSRSITII